MQELRKNTDSSIHLPDNNARKILMMDSYQWRQTKLLVKIVWIILCGEWLFCYFAGLQVERFSISCYFPSSITFYLITN